VRSAEIISIAFFGVFVVAAAVVPLPTARRVKGIGLGAAGILIAWLLQSLDALPGGAVARDFIPGFLLLVGYWQTGQFVVTGDPRFQALLERFDERWFSRATGLMDRIGKRRSMSHYFEVAYMACYPVVPLGVAALYLLDRTDAVDQFWRVVLPATYATHGLTAIFHSLPPWMVDSDQGQASRPSSLRWVNKWVTDNASIRFNSFPSGHVASSFAIAFVLFEALPAAGLAFLWIAASIAASSVLLRYHYVLDVLLGIGLAGVSYAIRG
jgi:membrane-associated phospholipid phosphatase